jgi:phosphopantothenoylcysteine decarboxylase/phosphopantothenate--cysteine ligase
VSKFRRVVLGVTGSIAAYKAADIIRALKEKGLRVSAVMTKEAEHFITPLTLSGLSGERVYAGMFSDFSSGEMPHIELAQNSDLILIAPATANIISKMACGLADDLLTCVVLATKAPILIAPAMNVEMYKNKIIQEHCSKLKSLGMKFVDPVHGKLACGTVGDGHIASEETIVKAVLAALK